MVHFLISLWAFLFSFSAFSLPFSFLFLSFSFSLSLFLSLSPCLFPSDRTSPFQPLPPSLFPWHLCHHPDWLSVTFLNSPFHPPWVQSIYHHTDLIPITDLTCPWACAPKVPWRYGPLVARASGTPSKWPVPKLLTFTRLLTLPWSPHWAENNPNAKPTARHGWMLQTAGAARPSCPQIDLSHH